MNRLFVRAMLIAAMACLAAVFVGACGSSDDPAKGTVSSEPAVKNSPRAEKAIAKYLHYLKRNTISMATWTSPMVSAIETGDIKTAQSFYPSARTPYGRIEPVVESFGDLNLRINAQESDVSSDEFGGFHRIEKALWAENTTAGMIPVAKQLVADVGELRSKVKTVDLQPAQIVSNANELMELSTSKLAGEEELYSHTDMVDFEANLEGSQAAFEAIEPLLSDKDPKLAKEIAALYEQIHALLKPYQQNSTFLPGAELSQADTRELTQKIDTLTGLLSRVPAQIAGA